MRILFISSTRLGDAVLTTGVLNHLATQFPEARFTVAAGPVAAPLFRALPGLERLVVMRKGRFHAHWLRLLAIAVPQFWGMVVDMRGSATAWLVPTRARRIYVKRDPDAHRVVDMSAMLGLATPAAPTIWLTEQHRAAGAALLGADDGRPILAIGPTANWSGKTWPAARFAALITRLTGPGGTLAGARVAILGGPGERPAAAPVIAAVDPECLIDLVDRAPLLELAAALSRATLYVGNDSGLMHMAAALGVPTLGLFGPSREENYRPWGAHCAFVRTDEDYDAMRDGPHFKPGSGLMDGLPVDRVLTAAHALLQRQGPV